jgi:hypothetical protein
VFNIKCLHSTRLCSTQSALSFAVLLLVLCFGLGGFAQERFGSISGTVADSSGAIVSEAAVTIVNNDTNRTFTTKTRSDGTFLAPDMEPGRYTVRVEKTGFSRFEAPSVAVLVGRTSNLTATMRVGTKEQIVEVSGAAPIIDTTSTMIAHNVTIEELNTLPKGRNFTEVAVFSPSVNTGQLEGGYQINGASGAENSYYIDGVATNSMIDGSARQSATFDYIQEVQVKTTGLDAEYGGALGGVVSAVTKSGGNTYHGDLHLYTYGNKFSAGPTERMQLDPNTLTSFQYFQDRKNKSDYYEFGGSLGGPIIKDKLFFYTAASPKWARQRNEYQFADGPGSMARSASQMNWFSKLSYQPISKLRLNFSYLYTPQSMTGSLYGYNSYAPNRSTNTLSNAKAVSGLGYFQPETSYTGEADYTLTNSSVLSLKAGRYWLDFKDTGVDANQSYWWRTSSIGIQGAPQFGANYATPTAAKVLHDLTTRTYIQADFSQLVRFAGQHNFKFGLGTAKSVNNVNDSSFGPNGRINLFWGQSCKICGGTTGAYGYYSVEDGATRGSAGSNVTHIYVQDSYKIFNRLVVNAGIRLEKETIPSFRPDIKKYAFQFGFGDKVAPRIGASYDLLGNGKVKVSGGWGRFYDWTKYDLARGTFGGDVWHIYYRALENPADVLSYNLTNMPGTDLWAASHNGSPFRDYRLPGFDLLDPGVKPMSSDTIHAGVEWEVRKDFVFTGRYVRNKLNRTIEDMGVLVNGNESYFYGNPGEGQNQFAPASGASCPTKIDGVCAVPMPKAKRTYDAMELSLSKRFGGGYLFNASYVYSRLWGNYSGLQSSDEIRPATLGYSFGGNQSFFGQIYRPGGNANRYFDLDEAYYDAHGNNGIYGRLPTDRPHVFKFYGSKLFKWGTEVGGFFRAMSGTPITTQVQTVNLGMYVNGRGDMGRTPMFNQTDLMVAQEFKIGEGKRLRFEFNMINLFNQKTSMFTFDRYNQEEISSSVGIDLSGVDLTKGFNWQQMAADAAAANGGVGLDPRYGKASVFNPGFQGRLLVKLTF